MIHINRGVSLNGYQTEKLAQLNPKENLSLNEAQKIIYAYFLERVRRDPPELVLSKFKSLLICPTSEINSLTTKAVYSLIFANNETEFRNTIKRSCYILVNNWDATRQHQAIRALIQLFSDVTLSWETTSLSLARLRYWIANFIKSKDYEDLKLFALKHEEGESGRWSHRYTSYLLAAQYLNRTNPIEQRKAAKELSKQLKEKFKFELAMYTARSESNSLHDNRPKNPTALGDEVLHLIKRLVARRGQFSYINLANIFIQQTYDISYQEFKQSLQKYLVIYIGDKDLVNFLQENLNEKINNLYREYDDIQINKTILVKTCKRLIDFFTTEDHQNPSQLFVLMITQKNPLFLVIVLLKIVLLCKPCRSYLEARIADLIQYYERLPEEDCKWVINFVDIFNIVFTIYAENVVYNVVKVDENGLTKQSREPWNNYRLFSQIIEKDNY